MAEKLALRHLVVAQSYQGKIQSGKYSYHPAEAMNTDISSSKQIDKNGFLTAKNETEYRILRNAIQGIYKYLFYLKRNSEDILHKLRYTDSVKLYRGINGLQKFYSSLDRIKGDTMNLPIPSSWALSLDSATSFVDHNSTDKCCLLRIDYPLECLIGFSALPPNYCLKNNKITEEYTSSMKYLEDAGIYIHNQPESEVILPAFQFKFTGWSSLTYNEEIFRVIDGIPINQKCYDPEEPQNTEKDLKDLMQNLDNLYHLGQNEQ
jgi:hypothetical protein